jgi:hypothetical protein
LKVRLNERLGIRFDVRDHVTGKPDEFQVINDPGVIHNLEFSAGWSWLF